MSSKIYNYLTIFNSLLLIGVIIFVISGRTDLINKTNNKIETASRANEKSLATSSSEIPAALAPENVETITGQAVSKDFKPTISNGIITGVATGTAAAPAQTQQQNNTPGAAIGASTDFQKEMQAARSRK